MYPDGSCIAVALQMHLIEVDTESAGIGLAKKRKGHCANLKAATVRKKPRNMTNSYMKTLGNCWHYPTGATI
jgi:hypothetical protein